MTKKEVERAARKIAAKLQDIFEEAEGLRDAVQDKIDGFSERMSDSDQCMAWEDLVSRLEDGAGEIESAVTTLNDLGNA